MTEYSPEFQDLLYSNAFTAPHLYRPIIMKFPGGGTNGMVVFTSPPSLNVTEGEEFDEQPSVMLFNPSSGKPISGVGCVAVINGKNDDIYPKGYVFSEYCTFLYNLLDNHAKYLVKPLAGDWSDDWRNPLADWLVKPRVTDKNGQISFTGLRFSVTGNIGNYSAKYRFQVICGNAKSREYNITVTSRIDNIALKALESPEVIISYNNLYDFITFLRVVDSDSNPMQGKIIDKVKVNRSNKYF